MLHARRPIAAIAVLGTLGFLAAGCTAGGTDPTPTKSHTASSTPSASASSTPSSGSSSSASAEPSDESSVPGNFPGSGQTGPSDPDQGDIDATALVTFASWDTGSKSLQAAGLVTGTTDTSGKCTFTATKGGTTRTLTSSASASASTINCAQVAFPASQVSSGTWSVTLKYTVSSGSTTSDPMTAEVP
jgi:hypothetical protein